MSFVVDVRDLLSCCCDAADRSAEIIRKLYGTEHGSAQWATVAAHAGNAFIVSALRESFPEIRIIADDIGHEQQHSSMTTEQVVALRRDHPTAAAVSAPPRWRTAPLDAVIVFVDALDESSRYDASTIVGISVRGEAVAGAIGRPFWQRNSGSGALEMRQLVAGCQNDAKGSSVLFCGIVDGTGGVAGLPAAQVLRNNDVDVDDSSGKQRRKKRLAISPSTGDSATALAAAAACDAICSEADFEPVKVVGTGSKIVSLLLGQCDAALFDCGTSMRQSIAEAVLTANNGRATDLFGARVFYTLRTAASVEETDKLLRCTLGMVATASPCVDHSSLVRRLSSTPAVTKILASTGFIPFASSGNSASTDSTTTLAVASDIARTIEGYPLTKEMLTAAILKPDVRQRHGITVAAFFAPESSAVRYMMSECARIHLRYARIVTHDQIFCADEEEKNKLLMSLPSSVFVKRCVMRELPHARSKIVSAPHKLWRDVRSYSVETAFLRSAACRKLSSLSPSSSPSSSSSSGIYLARALHSEMRLVKESPIDFGSLLLLEDFSSLNGWMQLGMFGPAELRAALRALARFHAFFWNGRVGDIAAPSKSKKTEISEQQAILDELDDSVNDHGTYWSPKRQGDKIDSLQTSQHAKAFITEVVAKQKQAGEQDESFIVTEADISDIGPMLKRYAPTAAVKTHLYLDDGEEVASGDGKKRFTEAAGPGPHPETGADRQSHRSQSHPFRTLLFGDAKAANWFLRKNTNSGGSSCSSSDSFDVGMIDFQWSGWGIGAADIAYLFCSAAGPDCLDLTCCFMHIQGPYFPDWPVFTATKERELLAVYHDELCLELARHGAAESAQAASANLLPFDVLVSQYEDALLDHAVTVFAYFWTNWPSPAVLKELGEVPPPGENSINTDVECAAWFIGRCVQLLKKKVA